MKLDIIMTKLDGIVGYKKPVTILVKPSLDIKNTQDTSSDTPQIFNNIFNTRNINHNEL